MLGFKVDGQKKKDFWIFFWKSWCRGADSSGATKRLGRLVQILLVPVELREKHVILSVRVLDIVQRVVDLVAPLDHRFAVPHARLLLPSLLSNASSIQVITGRCIGLAVVAAKNHRILERLERIDQLGWLAILGFVVVGLAVAHVNSHPYWILDRMSTFLLRLLEVLVRSSSVVLHGPYVRVVMFLLEIEWFPLFFSNLPANRSWMR